MISAIFLDRDGVINQNRDDYVKSWQEFIFLPGSLEGLRKLADFPGPILVITNQSAIGRGIVTADVVDEIHARMLAEIRAHGGRIDEIFVCPHHPQENCLCRKPKPGLLLQAQTRWNIDLSRSWLVGDSATDIQAAHSVNCRPFLVQTGRGRQQLPLLQNQAGTFTVIPDLLAFANLLMQAPAKQLS